MLLRTRVRRDSDLIRAVVGTAEGFVASITNQHAPNLPGLLIGLRKLSSAQWSSFTVLIIMSCGK